MELRVTAARILSRLARKKGALEQHLAPYRGQPGFGLLQEICYGVCRHHESLDFLLGQLLERPLRKRDSDLQYLLLGALHELRELAIPGHATVHETVEAAGRMGKGWSQPLVNAVLRSYQRRREALEGQLEQQPEATRLSHPPWLAEAIRADWPGHWRQLLASNNLRPPMTLRVNERKSPREDAMHLLRQAGLECELGKLARSAVYLHKPVPVSAIPGFADGVFSVQDEASQLVPGLLAVKPGDRVLDACAAPGGKTCHLLESMPELDCLALDRDSRRLAMIRENLDRLGLAARLAAADAREPATWWDSRPFARILLDAPCSATGVIRRHPDIKLLLRPGDIDRHANGQFELLRKLWDCLAPGGRLLYTTCSLLRRENEQVVARFLANASDAKPASIDADWGIECAHGRQLTPEGADGPDGFHFCLLEKT